MPDGFIGRPCALSKQSTWSYAGGYDASKYYEHLPGGGHCMGVRWPLLKVRPVPTLARRKKCAERVYSTAVTPAAMVTLAHFLNGHFALSNQQSIGAIVSARCSPKGKLPPRQVAQVVSCEAPSNVNVARRMAIHCHTEMLPSNWDVHFN